MQKLGLKRKIESLSSTTTHNGAGGREHVQHGDKNKRQKRESEFEQLQEFRRKLPVVSVRETLLGQLNEHSNLIIVAETGSGKTTQIPQFLHEAGWTRRGMIAVTQPRRVAAMTVAERVAKEMGVHLGREVGYSVRFDDRSSKHTKVKYLTDGMLLQETLMDSSLSKYSVIILDEAHERTLHTDVLFALLKKIQAKRSDLKVLAMSATLGTGEFSRYFNSAPVVRVSGRLHPVTVKYAPEPEDDPVDAAVIACLQIHTEQPEGDVLVFLPGQEQIENAVQLLADKCKRFPKECGNLIVLPLYAALPAREQMKVFRRTPKKHRKVIMSTNIAETSVTIDGVVYVVDCGLAKRRVFTHKTGVDSLLTTFISRSEAWQRSGRCGRVKAGTCYRLFTEEQFEAMKTDVTPEILRSNLAQVALQLYALNISNPLELDFMAKPKRSALVKAARQLQSLGAFEAKQTLSKLGRQMAQLPLEPMYAKVLISSREFGCTQEIVTILSILSVESIWHTPRKKWREADAAKKRFSRAEGDLLTYLSVFEAADDANFSKSWCHDNFINLRALAKAVKVRTQLVQHCKRLEIPLVSCNSKFDQVRKCLVTGMFAKAARLQQDGTYITLNDNQEVSIHPASVLHRTKHECIIYAELVKTSLMYLRDVTAIEPKWLAELTPSGH